MRQACVFVINSWGFWLGLLPLQKDCFARKWRLVLLILLQWMTWHLIRTRRISSPTCKIFDSQIQGNVWSSLFSRSLRSQENLVMNIQFEMSSPTLIPTSHGYFPQTEGVLRSSLWRKLISEPLTESEKSYRYEETNFEIGKMKSDKEHTWRLKRWSILWISQYLQSKTFRAG